MEPRLSFVVAADAWTTVSELAEALSAQTVASELELVLVGPDRAALTPPVELGALARLTIVEHPLLPLAAARAVGVRRTAADIVVLGETHVLPEPGWAAAILAAHEGPWYAVTPAIRNGNPPPRNALGEAALRLDYGRWNESRPAGPVDGVPRNNASFKRAALLEHDSALEELLEPLGDLAGTLGLAAGRAAHAPDARIGHLNVSKMLPWLAERYLTGRLTGGSRADLWSTGRRLLYAVAAPAIAARLLFKVVAASGLPRRPGVAVALVTACTVQSLGEAVGYVAGGVRPAEAAMLPYELHKRRYVAESAA